MATKGMLGDACAAGHRERRGMADGGARVPEVLSAAGLEGFFAGFVPEPANPCEGHPGDDSGCDMNARLTSFGVTPVERKASYERLGLERLKRTTSIVFGTPRHTVSEDVG